MNDKVSVGGIAGSVLTIMTAAGMTQEVVQIVYYVLGALALLFSLSFTIWKWYREAKKDGKITEEEVDDLFNKINDEIKEKKDNGSN